VFFKYPEILAQDFFIKLCQHSYKVPDYGVKAFLTTALALACYAIKFLDHKLHRLPHVFDFSGHFLVVKFNSKQFS